MNPRGEEEGEDADVTMSASTNPSRSEMDDNSGHHDYRTRSASSESWTSDIERRYQRLVIEQSRALRYMKQRVTRITRTRNNSSEVRGRRRDRGSTALLQPSKPSGTKTLFASAPAETSAKRTTRELEESLRVANALLAEERQRQNGFEDDFRALAEALRFAREEQSGTVAELAAARRELQAFRRDAAAALRQAVQELEMKDADCDQRLRESRTRFEEELREAATSAEASFAAKLDAEKAVAVGQLEARLREERERAKLEIADAERAQAGKIDLVLADTHAEAALRAAEHEKALADAREEFAVEQAALRTKLEESHEKQLAALRCELEAESAARVHSQAAALAAARAAEAEAAPWEQTAGELRAELEQLRAQRQEQVAAAEQTASDAEERNERLRAEIAELRARNDQVDTEFGKLLGKHDLELRTLQEQHLASLAARDSELRDKEEVYKDQAAPPLTTLLGKIFVPLLMWSALWATRSECV
eukprot:g13183.t1